MSVKNRRPSRLPLALASLVVSIGAGGCATPPRPSFGERGDLDDAAVIAALRDRTERLSAVSALLTIAYEGETRSGVFSAVARWRSPRLRLTAFKDLLVSTKDLFDLAFGAERFALDGTGFADDGDASVRDEGPLAAFAERQPEFAGFLWTREAMFLAGATAADASGTVAGDADGHGRVATRLPNGLPVTWTLAPATLEVLAGEIEAPDGRTIVIRYAEYAATASGEPVPHRILWADERAGTTLEVLIEELDVAPVFEDGDLELPE